MKDELISFETAKLAKEKGFKLQSNPFGYITKFYRPLTGTLLSYGRTGRSKIDDLIYASTQSLLQKWLREVHNIHIEVSLANFNGKYAKHYKVDVYTLKQVDNDFQERNITYTTTGKSYEDALESGLQDGLIKIKL